MRLKYSILSLAALLAGAAAFPLNAYAGSCCGGGGQSASIMPAAFSSMADLSVEKEVYDGYWDSAGKVRKDPPGSRLLQYRATLTAAHRFSERGQASISLPWVWNLNDYPGVSSGSQGPGDTAISAWYEALRETSSWRVLSAADLIPEVQLGAALTVPTGISPYDDVENSFEVTGRGFYRLDANLYVSKTIHPLTASLSASYGLHLKREVNREYGRYVEPYEKLLGDRVSLSCSLGYIAYFGTGGDSITASASISRITEGDAELDGKNLERSGFSKTSWGLSLAYASTDHDWQLRAGTTRAVSADNWGEDFPITNVYSLGVRYGFR